MKCGLRSQPPKARRHEENCTVNLKKSTLRGVRRTTILAAASILLLVGTTACANAGAGTADAPDAANTAPYKVGVLLALTGAYASVGTPQRDAINLYFEDVNANGGIDGHPVELTVLDTASDPATAINQLRQLAVQDEVDIVLGPSASAEGIALKPFAKSLKIPVVSLGSAETIIAPATDATYIFKMYTGTSLSLEAQLELVKERGWKKIALLYQNGYGQDAANLIEAASSDYKFDLVASEVFEPAATDVTAQLTKVAAADPDVVLVWALNPLNAIIAKYAESLNFDPALLFSPGAGSPSFIENAGTAGEGTLLQGSKVLAASTMEPDDPQYEVTQDFVTKYTAKYSEAPGQYAGSAWDASILFANAVSAMDQNATNVQERRDAIRDSLESNTKDVAGVNGIFTFTPEVHGSTGLTGLAVLRVEDGKFLIDKAY